MYYNIKIKSQGSELSLECPNKDITQREMDLYFAHIFNIEELKLMAKKVTINSDSIKSISILDGQDFEAKTPETKTAVQDYKENNTDTAKSRTEIQIQKDSETGAIPAADTAQFEARKTIPESSLNVEQNSKNEAPLKINDNINAAPVSNQTAYANESVFQYKYDGEQTPPNTQIRDTITDINFKSTNQAPEILIADNETIPTDEAENNFEIPTPVLTEDNPPQIPAAGVSEIIKIQNNTIDEVIFSNTAPAPSLYKNENITIPPREVFENKTDEISIQSIEPVSDKEVQSDSLRINLQNDTENKNQNDLENFITIVQKEVDSMDISSNKTEGNLIDIFTRNAEQLADNSINMETNTIEFNLEQKPASTPIINMEQELNQRVAIQTNNQAKVDNIFSNFAADKQTTPQIEEETLIIDESDIKINLSDDTVAVQSKNDNELLTERSIETGGNFMQSQNSISEPSYTEMVEPASKPPITPEIPQEQTNVPLNSIPAASFVQNTSQSANLDFGAFIKGLNASGLSDEFLICAFYIKNILNQSCFTMKFINSKLFQSTGKIADMSIVEELIQKEFIKFIELEDSKSYCITQKGESYFASKYRS